MCGQDQEITKSEWNYLKRGWLMKMYVRLRVADEYKKKVQKLENRKYGIENRKHIIMKTWRHVLPI